MILRNLEKHREIIRVDTSSGESSLISEAEADGINPVGGFFMHEGLSFGLSAEDGCIWLIISGRPLKYENGMATTLANLGRKNEFKLYNNERLVFSINYKPKKPSWNFFTVEDEDVDHFCWMHNVLSRPERKAVLLLVSASNSRAKM